MLNSIDLGQVFTNRKIADYMVGLFTLPVNAEILDPCFGEGVFIDSVIKNTDFNVTGIEIDKSLFETYRKVQNVERCQLYNMEFLLNDLTKTYNGILMNPPYIRHEKINDLSQLGVSKEKLRTNLLYRELNPTANLYMYFIVRAINMLKQDGELIAIFPETWINSRDGKNFRDYLSRNCSVLEKIFVKGKAFDKNALVDVLILKLKKSFTDNTSIEKCVYFNGETIKHLNNEKVTLSKERLVTLIKYGTLRRGITTGNNKMFVGNFSNREGWNFVTEKILSSPKSINGFTTKKAVTDDLLVISDLKGTTQEIFDYIESWKENITRNSSPKTQFAEIENNSTKWYKIKTFDCKGLLFSYIIRNNMKFIINVDEVLVRDNFYIIYPNIDFYLLFSLLNNYYTYVQLEEMGKRYGAGLLKLQKYDLEKLLLIDIDVISDKDMKILIKMAKKAIDLTDENVIDEINVVISKYHKITHEEVKALFQLKKSHRLGGNL